jgi:hypothetical protein
VLFDLFLLYQYYLCLDGKGEDIVILGELTASMPFTQFETLSHALFNCANVIKAIINPPSEYI